MSDLVERLRAKYHRPTRDINLGNGTTIVSFGLGYSSEDDSLRIEAADRIVELEAENKTLGSINYLINRDIQELAAQNVALKDALEGAYDYVEEAIQRYLAEYGEAFRPHRLKYIRDVKASCDTALTLPDIATPIINRLKAEALREAAEWFDENSYANPEKQLRRMADELSK